MGVQINNMTEGYLVDKINKISSPTPTTGVGKDAGKKEPSYTVGGNVN
jgi:hypothetical protein